MPTVTDSESDPTLERQKLLDELHYWGFVRFYEELAYVTDPLERFARAVVMSSEVRLGSEHLICEWKAEHRGRWRRLGENTIQNYESEPENFDDPETLSD